MTSAWSVGLGAGVGVRVTVGVGVLFIEVGTIVAVWLACDWVGSDKTNVGLTGLQPARKDRSRNVNFTWE